MGVGNCHLKIKCNFKAQKPWGVSFEPFRIVATHHALEQPVNCIFGDIWRIPRLLGGDSLHVSWQLSPENEMSYQGKETLRCVIWTIQNRHDTRYLKDSSLIGDRQLAHKLAIVNWEWNVILIKDNVKVCHFNHSEFWNSLSTASLKTFEGSIINWG